MLCSSANPGGYTGVSYQKHGYHLLDSEISLQVDSMYRVLQVQELQWCLLSDRGEPKHMAPFFSFFLHIIKANSLKALLLPETQILTMEKT